MDTPIDEGYRAAVERSLADRIPPRVARAHGMPKDSIHTVLRGHAPNLVRADAICRALGFTFVLGASEAVGASSHAGPRVDRAPVGDVQLAEMISRLVDRWETTPVRERAGLALAITSLLDLAGARPGASLGRTLEYLGWRVLEARIGESLPRSD